jgi:hypothetical protein
MKLDSRYRSSKWCSLPCKSMSLTIYIISAQLITMDLYKSPVITNKLPIMQTLITLMLATLAHDAL